MRQSYREAGPRKRRVLKLDVWEIEGAEVEEPGDIDIKDVEFRLSNNSVQVQVSQQMLWFSGFSVGTVQTVFF
jgi:hypothetical protein